MSDDLKIQGEVSVSSEGAERAFDRVADSASRMAGKVQKEADKAGKAVDSIGTGAADSAEQFTRAEAKISSSIKRATTQLEQLGKTASQKLEFRIAEKGLDPSKFEPALAKLRELEAAQNRVTATSRGFGSGLQNASYQLQDFVVQVNGGTDATRALSMQLPQMLVGFGAAGAAIGLIASLMPNLASAMTNTAEGSKTFKEAISGLDQAIGDVGQATRTFDMENLYEQFNKSSAAVRAATIEQLNFQREYIRTAQLVSEKKFGESLGGLGDFGMLDKLAGAYGNSGAERLAKQLGVSLTVAQDLLPVLNGLRAGTEDVGLAFNRFGTTLLGGNQKAIDLAQSMATLSKSEKDAASASSALSEAQEKMLKGTVETKKERDAAAKSAKQEAEALTSLLDTINGKSSDLDASYVKNVETLLVAYGKGKLTLEEFNAVFERYKAMQPGAIAAAKELAKAEEEAQKSRNEYMRGLGDETAKLIEKADASEKELRTIGLSGDELARLTAARYDEQIAIKQAEYDRLNGIDGREAEVHLIEQQIIALNRLKSSEVAKPKLQQQAREWENFTRDIEQSLTDALYRSFESGKGFGESFADSLENTFKSMVLKFAVQATMSTGGNLLNSAINAVLGTSGNNGGAGTNYLGLASNASSIYNLGSGAYASYGALGYQWATGSMSGANALGTAYANATGTGLDGLLATNGAYGTASGTAAGSSAGASSGASASSMSAGTVAWVAAIIMAMYMDSEMWRKGIRWENYAKESQNSGAFLGSSVSVERMANDLPWKMLYGDSFVNSQWYSIATGSSLAAALQGAFEKALFGKTRQTGSQTAGQFSEAEQGFSGQYGINMKKSGSLFSKSREWTDWYALPGEFDNVMDTIYRSVRNSFVMLGDTFNDSSIVDKLNGFVYRFSIATTDSKSVFESASSSLSEAMGNLLTPAVTQARKDGETWQQAFTRVLIEANSVMRVFDLMGDTMAVTFGQNNLNGILKASDAFVQLFGSVDAFNQSFSSYYGNFYTRSEQTAQAWEDMQKAFDGLDITMPTTRQGFRALVDSLDLSTDAGRSTFKSLMDLQGAFAALTPTIEDATAAAQAQAKANLEMQARQIGAYYDYQRSLTETSLRSSQQAAAQTADTAAALIASFGAISTSLSDYRTNLLASSGAISPAEQYANAKRQYETTAAKARLGDLDAAGRLQTVSDAFLAAALNTGTAESYARDLGSVLGTVDSVINMADRQIPIAQSQLDVANQQLTTLNAMLDALRGGQSPALVANYQQAATDWASFFSTTAIGDVVQTAAGAMQRISDSMGLFVDQAGNGYTFGAGDSPYVLAGQSAAWREEMLRRYGQWVPGFANGGYHAGGMRLVGERGPELEVTGPAHIANSNATDSLLQNFDDMVEELRALRAEVSKLRDEQMLGNGVIAANTRSMAKTLDKFDNDGLPAERAA